MSSSFKRWKKETLWNRTTVRISSLISFIQIILLWHYFGIYFGMSVNFCMDFISCQPTTYQQHSLVHLILLYPQITSKIVCEEEEEERVGLQTLRKRWQENTLFQNGHHAEEHWCELNENEVIKAVSFSFCFIPWQSFFTCGSHFGIRCMRSSEFSHFISLWGGLSYAYSNAPHKDNTKKLFLKIIMITTTEIGDFRVAFRLCFKASPSAKPFIWKSVLFTCKFWFIYVWIKLISIWKASH